MCKAKDYVLQLDEIFRKINKDFMRLTNELSQADRYEQDILHIIEDGKFNACEGYKLSKLLCENRQKRRVVKNELEPLILLKNKFIDKNTADLYKTLGNITNKEKGLNNLTENRIYNPRVLDSTDLKVVVAQ